MNRLLTSLALFLFLIPSIVSSSEEPAVAYDQSMAHEVEAAIANGMAFLASTQDDDGSWSKYPGVTGLAVAALCRAPEGLRTKYTPQIENGLQFILGHVKPNGGIYPDYEPELRSYNTAICLMALVASEQPGLEDVIINARDYLLSLQADEDEGINIDSSTYGGIGYNRDERSDISNMQFALEALRASENFKPSSEYGGKVEFRGNIETEVSETSNKELFWEKAILFLQRCQNYKEYNDYAWSSDDGGFVYYPGVSKAGGTTSYGGMTYAGIKSFIHAGLDREDDRVQAAYRWIRSNFTVDTNPELGEQGLYYYYHTMAKALTIYGDSIVTDTSGIPHDWRGELANKLISVQQSDGSWVNTNGRWWENNPHLVTSYCILALEEILKTEGGK